VFWCGTGTGGVERKCKVPWSSGGVGSVGARRGRDVLVLWLVFVVGVLFCFERPGRLFAFGS